MSSNSDDEYEFWVVELSATTLLSDIAKKMSEALMSDAIDVAAARSSDETQLVITVADVVAAAKKMGLSAYL